MSLTASHVRVLMLLENASYPEDSRVSSEAQCLADAGHEVSVICPTGDSRKRFENLGGVHVYRYPEPWSIDHVLGYLWEYAYSLSMAFAISLYVLVRRGFDVVHTHAPPDMFVVVAGFYKIFGKKYVADLHDLGPEMYDAKRDGQGNSLLKRALLWFERRSCRLADRLIATNETQREIQIQRGGADPERCCVVRNGPNERFLRNVEPIQELRERGKTIIGYVGMIDVQDGVDYLMRAAYRLRNDLGRSDFLVVIVGTGPALDEVKQLTRDLGLDDMVLFAGYQVGDDLLRHIASFDIGATPDPSTPYNDSCTTIKTMEYMAMGKPTVSFDLPEARITAREAALYAPANDELAFASHIEVLMDDPAKRESMGRIGRERIENELSWMHQQANLLALYDSLSPMENRQATGPNIVSSHDQETQVAV